MGTNYTGMDISKPSPENILRNTDFLHLWSAGAADNICRRMDTVVLALLLLDLTNSPWMVALVGVFRWGPFLFFGVFSGVIADRISRWRVMIVARLAHVITAAVLLFLLYNESIEAWHILGAGLVLGIGFVLEWPSRRSFIFDVVGREKLVAAMGLDSANNMMGKMIGPLMGGLLVQGIGFTGAMAVLAGGYSLALLSITLIRKREIGEPLVYEAMWQSIANGIKYCLHDKMVLGVLGITVVMNAMAFSSEQLFTVIGQDHLQVGAGLTGFLIAAMGMGSLVGTLIIARFGARSHFGRLFALGSALHLVTLILFAISQSYVLSFFLLLIMGLGNAGFSTMQSTIMLSSPPPEMRGRAMGVLGLCIGSQPLGLLEIGAIATILTTNAAIGINAIAASFLLIPIVLLTRLATSDMAPATT
jgi:MFS family permease